MFNYINLNQVTHISGNDTCLTFHYSSGGFTNITSFKNLRFIGVAGQVSEEYMILVVKNYFESLYK